VVKEALSSDASTASINAGEIRIECRPRAAANFVINTNALNDCAVAV
jgi:hypothetical protein